MDDEDQREVRFRHITEITILTVQLIVEFAKQLPGFDKLLREDQIALLKVNKLPKKGIRQFQYSVDLGVFEWGNDVQNGATVRLSNGFHSILE